ncbi:hypothetical protein HK096_004521 [Nowakowskiella sp. JEL0078]|nr:hypothetical protein HK096_004521 [Nowakowskiella sp. JEL0078]
MYFKDIPVIYRLHVAGLDVSDKIFIYVLAFQLLLSNYPGSLISGIGGLTAGILYKANFANIKNWRIPATVSQFCEKNLLPFLESPPVTRTQTAVSVNANQQRNVSIPTASGQRQVQIREQDVETLVSMGFDRERVISLLRSGLNVERVAAALIE